MDAMCEVWGLWKRSCLKKSWGILSRIYWSLWTFRSPNTLQMEAVISYGTWPTIHQSTRLHMSLRTWRVFRRACKVFGANFETISQDDERRLFCSPFSKSNLNFVFRYFFGILLIKFDILSNSVCKHNPFITEGNLKTTCFDYRLVILRPTLLIMLQDATHTLGSHRITSTEYIKLHRLSARAWRARALENMFG